MFVQTLNKLTHGLLTFMKNMINNAFSQFFKEFFQNFSKIFQYFLRIFWKSVPPKKILATSMNRSTNFASLTNQNSEIWEIIEIIKINYTITVFVKYCWNLCWHRKKGYTVGDIIIFYFNIFLVWGGSWTPLPPCVGLC